MKNIETNRLLLRRPIEEDILILSQLWQNELVRAFLGGIVSADIIHKKILTLQQHWEQYKIGFFTVIDKNNKEIIGLCGPHYSEEENIEISYMLFPNFWGKGFAQEAIMACIEYCFNILNIDTVIAITQKANLKSCRLLEKVGMKYINHFERFNAIQCKYELKKND